MRLVVCVDRDDDLGRKAGVPGPVVGRAAVLEAAAKLGVADPGDCDTNAMYAAVQLLDEIRRHGDESEIVVLTGSPKVGIFSDRRVAEQFDTVLKEHPAGSAHLVSDGAEDEYLFPILASRVRIDGVHRVYVRQSASIESTYYTMVRALKDPKFRTKTVLPLALLFIALGLAAAAGVVWYGLVTLSIAAGIYLVAWTFDIDEAIIESVRSASSDIRQGSVAFGFALVSLALVAIGFLLGYNQYVGHPGSAPVPRSLLFVSTGLLWWFVGGEVWESGRALRRYLTSRRIGPGYPIVTISIVGLGLLSYGVVNMIDYFESASLGPPLWVLVAFFASGFALTLVSALLSQRFRSRAGPAEETTPEGAPG
jgi:putative membrane protein